jgi:RNA polymerase sigma-70 factor (ECF subfamily)
MDDATYREVVMGTKDRVFGYAARILNDREEAKDVAQEALVRLWEHREKVPDTASAGAWLLRTAHNLCFDRLRLRSSRPEAGPELLEELSSPGDVTPHADYARRETGQRIERALSTMSARDRAALLLRDAYGLSYDELAAALGVPLGTAKALLHRARERARARLVTAGVRP